MKILAKKKELSHQEEGGGKRVFLASYTFVKEDDRQINEEKAPEWMDVEIKTKEVDISNNDRPKLAKIGD